MRVTTNQFSLQIHLSQDIFMLFHYYFVTFCVYVFKSVKVQAKRSLQYHGVRPQVDKSYFIIIIILHLLGGQVAYSSTDGSSTSLNSTFCTGMWQPNEPRDTTDDVAIASNTRGRWALVWVWMNLPFVCRAPACPVGKENLALKF